MNAFERGLGRDDLVMIRVAGDFRLELVERQRFRRRASMRRRVFSLLKYALPCLAILLLLIVVAWPQIRPSVDHFRVGTLIRERLDADGPPVVNAQYVGLDQSGRPFSVTASTVTNVDKDNVTMVLANPEADITLSDGAWLALSAEKGRYNRIEETLELLGAVNLYHDAGYHVRTDEATVNFTTGIAYGLNPVFAQGPLGQIEAEGFEVVDQGKTIVFQGKSKMKVFPSAASF